VGLVVVLEAEVYGEGVGSVEGLLGQQVAGRGEEGRWEGLGIAAGFVGDDFEGCQVGFGCAWRSLRAEACVGDDGPAVGVEHDVAAAKMTMGETAPVQGGQALGQRADQRHQFAW
jgi:hypothetical protein